MSEQTVVYESCNDDKKCDRGFLGDLDPTQRIAFVEFTQAYSDGVIHLCPAARNVHFLRFFLQDSEDYGRAFTVVHEMHHVANETYKSFPSIDKYYSKWGCELLAQRDPDQAAKNANNYAYYVMGEYWTRPTPPVSDAPAAMGLWHAPVVGGAWGESAASPAAAGTDFLRKVVIVAWRAPDDKGGGLWHRILHIQPISETWTDIMPLSRTLPDGSKVAIETIGAPAVEISRMEFICAYVDRATNKLMCVATEETKAFQGIPSDYSHLLWNRAMEIANEPLLDPTFKPAIVAYRDVTGIRNLSLGLYCVYRNNRNELTCRVRLDSQAGTEHSNWINLPFDKYRVTYGNPALVLFDNQLKCVYWNERGHFISLTYQPVIGGPLVYVPEADPVGNESKLGSWREDSQQIADLADSKMITLGAWGHTTLMAVRNKDTGAEANSLFYSRFDGNAKNWSPDERMPSRNSPHCPALAACGSSSFLFFVDPLGRIEGVKRD